MKTQAKTLIAAMALAVTSSASAVEIVNQLLPGTPTPVAGQWYLSDMRGNGTATIEDLSGMGGDLENNQPLPTGALKLTTGFDNNDKAEVGTFDDFGSAISLLMTMEIEYSYYKQTVAGGNAASAPSIKLAISAPGHGPGNDNYGQLVYEPTWNQPGGGSQNSPVDAWQSILIDADTGDSDGTGTGGWWWTGGFEIASGSGGPPIKSLSEWADDFLAADPTDFAAARVIGVSIGVGTYNQGHAGYVDEVTLSGTLADETYNFEVPEPGSLALLSLGAVAMLQRRRTQA